MEERRNLPNINQLSVLASTIMLVYAITPFIKIPSRSLDLSFLGIRFFIPVDIPILISFLAALLAAVGADWLVREHPRLGEQRTFQYWILPALTAWVIGVPLNSLTPGLQWWAVFGLGGLLLVLVFVAEYIVVDLSDARQAPASIVLTGVSYAMLLFLAIALRASSLRLYLAVPPLIVTVIFLCLRSLYLRLGGKWCLNWALVIGVILGQFAIGLQYWPIKPLAYGLAILGPAYALIELAGSYEDGQAVKTFWIGPALMLVVFWMMAFLLGR